MRVGRLGSARGARSARSRCEPGSAVRTRRCPALRRRSRRSTTRGSRIFIHTCGSRPRGRSARPFAPTRPGAHLGRALAHLHGAERRGGGAQVPARGRAAGGPADARVKRRVAARPVTSRRWPTSPTRRSTAPTSGRSTTRWPPTRTTSSCCCCAATPRKRPRRAAASGGTRRRPGTTARCSRSPRTTSRRITT